MTISKKKRIELSAVERSFLLDPERMPKEIAFKGNTYRLHEPRGTGFKSVVWKCTDQFGRKRALKFAVAADYDESGIHTEVFRTVALEQYPQFARLDDAGLI